eukprot:SAG22_NODE_1236_length_5055_cov_12.649593_4_plen_230_part_00
MRAVGRWGGGAREPPSRPTADMHCMLMQPRLWHARRMHACMWAARGRTLAMYTQVYGAPRGLGHVEGGVGTPPTRRHRPAAMVAVAPRTPTPTTTTRAAPSSHRRGPAPNLGPGGHLQRPEPGAAHHGLCRTELLCVVLNYSGFNLGVSAPPPPPRAARLLRAGRREGWPPAAGSLPNAAGLLPRCGRARPPSDRVFIAEATRGRNRRVVGARSSLRAELGLTYIYISV